jgi:hypothetical protein
MYKTILILLEVRLAKITVYATVDIMDIRPRPAKLRILVIAAVICVAVAVVGFMLLTKSSFLLPASTVQQVTGFTPYFYNGSVPAGYTFDASRITYGSNILMLPLTKSGSATIIMTEQQLPDNLSDQDIQQNGESVTSTVGKASINTIEGRLVGTLIVRDRKTLIILNAPGEASKDDIRALLQGLVPVR